MTCPVMMPGSGGRSHEDHLCNAPLARYGLCAKHADDHDRLCDGCERCSGRDGCERCSGPDERYPCGCVRYGDRWVPEGCAMHAAVGGVL